MRIAVVGAGGVGGGFGAALAKAGADVSFLARGAHLAAMKSAGLKVLSPRGDTHLVPTRATDNPAEIGPVDIVLFEGFRSAPIPMIEVFRPSLGRPMLWPTSAAVVAVASDGDVTCPLPVLDLAQPQAVAAFVVAHLQLAQR